MEVIIGEFGPRCAKSEDGKVLRHEDHLLEFDDWNRLVKISDIPVR
jgi:hypothetical protein